MPVPSVMTDLSVTESSNSPLGADPVGTSLDNYLRGIQRVIRTTNAKAADIASATTTDIGAAVGEFVTVTGTTTITGLGTTDAGIVRTVHFSGALTITHNATSLILPGGVNYTTVAGDVLQFRSLGSGNWRCVGVTRASSAGVNIPIIVANISALNALTGMANDAVAQTLGYYTDNDGGHGTYRYDSSSSATVNGGTVINAAGGVGRWLLLNDGIINIKQFGAKCDGATDDAAAIQAATNYAIATGNIRIEFANECIIGSPITISAVTGITFSGGKIKASGTFSTSEFMFKTTGAGGLDHKDITFENMVLDANRRGGCIKLDNYIRVSIKNCRIIRFTTSGIKLDKTVDSHECYIDNCYVFEYLYGDSGYAGAYTGIGIEVNSFDNVISKVVSYYTGTPIKITAQFNFVISCHLGGGGSGVSNALHLTSTASWISVIGTYVDISQVLVENPWNTEFIGCKFLHATSDATKKFLVLKPLSAGLAIIGFKVIGCSFFNTVATTIESIYVDTSVGSFSAANIVQCSVKDNSFVNANQKTTHPTASVSGVAVTSFSRDFSSILAFGAVQKCLYSVQPQTAGIYVASGVQISGNTVIVTTQYINVGAPASNVTVGGSFTGTCHISASVNVGDEL